MLAWEFDMNWQARFIIASAVMMTAFGSLASPWRPSDVHAVVDRLPANMPKPINTTPRAVSIEAAAPQIQALLEQAYTQGDPRALGQAEALLDAVAPSQQPDAQLLRASLAQANHQFDQSKRLLNTVLVQSPNQADALLMLSSIELVQGRFNDAKAHCLNIKDLSLLVIRLACTTQVDLMTQPVASVQPRLTTLTGMSQGLTASQARWIWLMQADAAQRSHDAKAAAEAFAHLDDSMPALMAQADWLLANRQWQAVRNLLIDHTDNDSLLLRLVTSELALKHADAAAHLQLLGQRIAVWQQRGETAHQREEAAYAQLIGNTSRALQLARSNWQHQRETGDVVIYATAALAVGSTADIAILRTWMQQNGFDYPILAAHLKRGRLPNFTQ